MSEPIWINPAEIAAMEAHARVDQELYLGDVLAVLDQLTGLFVPETRGRMEHRPSTAQLAALQALESGLFGRLRSLREVIISGRIENVLALGRTLDEIRKRTTVCVADPAFAERVASNTQISMRELDERYEEVLLSRGRSRSASQRERDRAITDKQSWILHARHPGLQAQTLETGPKQALIIREPRAGTLPDRGRADAIQALVGISTAAREVVPPILAAMGIDEAEWRRRETALGEALENLVAPYLVRAGLQQLEPTATFEVDACGALLRNGAGFSIERTKLEEAISLALKARPVAPVKAENVLDEWRRDFGVIYADVQDLAVQRHLYREIIALAAANPELEHVSSDVFEWMAKVYSHAAVVAVRKQVDRGPDTTSLRRLLLAIAHRPELLSREAYVVRGVASRNSPQPGELEAFRQIAEKRFDELAGVGAPSLTAPAAMADVARLDAAVAAIRQYTNRLVAHRGKGGAAKLPTWDELNVAIDTIAELIRKYNELLAAGLAPQLVPTWQYDWKDSLRVAWMGASRDGEEKHSVRAESPLATSGQDD